MSDGCAYGLAFDLGLLEALVGRSLYARVPRKNLVVVSSRPTMPARRSTPPQSAALESERAQRLSGIEPRSTTLDFERVYVEHFAHVARWARALGGLDADVDDLAQDVFMVVRRKLDTFDGPSVSAWLYGITRKTVSDYRRRAWFRRLWSGVNRSLDTVPPGEHAAATHPFERWEAQRIMERVLARMSVVRRGAFMLFEIEGYSGEEIAELEGIPVATVYTRLHHARQDFLRITAEITGDSPEEPPP